MRLRVPLTMMLVTGFVTAAVDAGAVPAYARKHELACTQCHSAWPLLNKFGRTFKENGYKLDREKPTDGNGAGDDVVIDDMLSLGRTIPLSFRLQGRPVEKRNVDDRFRMRVAHEIEFQLTDSVSSDYSYFFNIESEDETGWAVELADLATGWHPRAEANVIGGYASLTFADGYNTFSSRRLTQDRPTPINTGFQSGHRFRDTSPFVTFYGRAQGLYYSATVGTGRSDVLGADKRDFFLRAAYDLPGGLSIGAFSLIGDTELASSDQVQEFNRAGVDLQLDHRRLTANVLWYQADEQAATTLVSQKNNAWYAQVLYVIPTRVRLVPLVRFEGVESNDGRDTTNVANVALAAYVRGNINVSVEHMWQTKVPQGRPKADRTSLLFQVGF